MSELGDGKSEAQRIFDSINRVTDSVDQLRQDMGAQHSALATRIETKFESLDQRDQQQDVRLTTIETAGKVSRWLTGTLIALAGVLIALVALWVK